MQLEAYKKRKRILIRKRLFYLLIMGIVLLLGLTTRMPSLSMPHWYTLYAGDFLWALLVYLGFRVIFIDKDIGFAALLAFLFAFTVELSQLYRAPWINAIRQMRIGALILGHGFLWSDLICYATGIGFGLLMDHLYRIFISSRR